MLEQIHGLYSKRSTLHNTLRSSEKSTLRAFYTNTIFSTALAGLAIWMSGGKPVSPAHAEKGMVVSKDTEAQAIGQYIEIGDMKSSLKKMEGNCLINLSLPLKSMIANILKKDVNGKDLIDELYLCADGNSDGKITVPELKAVCGSIEGMELDIEKPLPSRLKVAEDSPLTPRLKNFLENNWEELKSFYAFVRLFAQA